MLTDPQKLQEKFHTNSMSKEPELQEGGSIASTVGIKLPASRPDTQRNKGLIRFALNDPQELKETAMLKEPELRTGNGFDSTDGINIPITTPRLQGTEFQ